MMGQECWRVVWKVREALVVYRYAARATIVERLREAEG